MHDVVVDQMLEFPLQRGAVFKCVDANHGEVSHEFLGLLDVIDDGALLVGHDYPKGRRVVDSLAEQHPIGIRIDGEVGPEQGVGERHHDRAFERFLPAQDGVGGAQGLVLVADVALGAQAFGHREQVPLHLVAKLPSDEHDVLDGLVRGADNVFHEALHDGLACDVHQGLGHGERVGAEAGSTTRHGYDDVHGVKSFQCGQILHLRAPSPATRPPLRAPARPRARTWQ